MNPEAPMEMALSPRVRIRIHPTGRVEIIVKAPWPLPDPSFWIEPDELDLALSVFKLAVAARERHAARKGNDA